MKAKVVMALSAAVFAGSLIAMPATTFAGGDAKAKCEAKAKKKKIADKDMEAYMKKCMAKKEKKAAEKK